MSRKTIRGAVACAALAMSLSAGVAAASAAPASRQTTAPGDTGFAVVARLPFTTSRAIASPTDGVAYVAGTVDNTIRVIRITRTATGTTAADVALPQLTGRDPWITLAARDGRTYMVTGDEYDYNRFFSLDGTKATELTLPTKHIDRTWPTRRFNLIYGISLDGPTSIWLSGVNRETDPRAPVQSIVIHGDGKTWSTLPSMDSQFPGNTYAVDGHFFQNTWRPRVEYLGWSHEWTGSAWVDRGLIRNYFDTDLPETFNWTFVTRSDFTRWGSIPVYGGARGACRHITTDGSTATPCIAPEWPVNAAVRLADGTVVLGGTDSVLGSHPSSRPSIVPSGFAIVPKPGAAPAPVAGSTGGKVIDLAAATSGSTVWALTPDGPGIDVQVMVTPSPTNLHGPRPHLKPQQPKQHVPTQHHPVPLGPWARPDRF